MKNLAVVLLLISPFVINAQEPTKEKNGIKTPPTNEKSISEKGISHSKGRGLTVKQASTTTTPTPAVNTTEATKKEQTPQEDPKNKEKDKKDPKEGTSTKKAITEKGITSTKKKRSAPIAKPKEKPAPATTTATVVEEKKN